MSTWFNIQTVRVCAPHTVYVFRFGTARVFLSVLLSVFLSVCLIVCLSVLLSVCLIVCLIVCLSVLLSELLRGRVFDLRQFGGCSSYISLLMTSNYLLYHQF